MHGFHTFSTKNTKKLILSIALPLLVGALSALLSGNQSEVLAPAAKPPLMPPSWLFPVAWTILYTLMGISAYLIRTSDANAPQRNRALAFYYVQLFFNFMWSIFFFRFGLFGFSFFWLLALLALVIIYAFMFFDISRCAGWLTLPYIAWLAFATYLNYMLWILN